MANYIFRAVDDKSNILIGKLRARNESDLKKMLSLRRLTLIEAERIGIFDFKGLFKTRFSQRNLLDITYFLSIIVSSGISITKGLEDLKKLRRKKLSLIAEQLHSDIESGMSLSEAMTGLPGVFPEYYIQMIRAGEISGNLEHSIQHLMNYLESNLNLRKTIVSYLIYPSIVIILMIFLVLLLFAFVFPKLITILTNLRADPPLPTKLIILVTNFMNKYFFYLIIGTILSVISISITSKKFLSLKRIMDRFIISLPILGDILKKTDLSGYLKTLRMLYESGSNAETIFSLSPNVVKNLHLSDLLRGVTESIIAGENITQSMIKAGIFPSLIIDIIAMGEKTSTLDTALQRSCDIIDKEISETIKKLFTLLEPLLIVLLGFFILIVLLSIFLPIYRIVGSIRVR